MRRQALLIRYHLRREVALHLKEGGCFDICSALRALFRPTYRGRGGRIRWEGGVASTMFLCRHSSPAALLCRQMEGGGRGVALSKNWHVGAIKLAAEI